MSREGEAVISLSPALPLHHFQGDSFFFPYMQSELPSPWFFVPVCEEWPWSDVCVFIRRVGYCLHSPRDRAASSVSNAGFLSSYTTNDPGTVWLEFS